MPKTFEYKGFHFFFFSNDHPPPHSHVTKGGVRAKLELTNIGGVILPKIKYIGRGRFTDAESNDIIDFALIYGIRMINKWNQYFNGQKPKCEKIKRLAKVKA